MEFNKPEKKHIHIRRNEGKYNMLSSDSQAQYVFIFPRLTRGEINELDIKTSYLVELDRDYGWEEYSAIDLAYQLKDTYEEYMFHSNLGDINKLIEYLESIKDEQDKLKLEYDISYAEYKIMKWKDRLNSLI